ncbi:threonine/serine exporter family protein [Bifidobacterium pullorum subsp. saeculare]|uniref:Threonine/serine exporter family protein n=1 Tax=Bifidobacterium pullorum subsp. saeculare TaxID=78257 RepID=A0A938WZE5_9BIFI|nr:threonine/serine exporter family protein [Bifidobacterium pullorum]MBM6700468.1 threonine/serine exporter family protein [Bifidobacterium pullorum subsp. saeculare]
MEDIERDWDKPVTEAGIAAKASVVVRVGMLDLGAGTGSFRVREMMHRIAYPLGVHVRADVNLTDIEASCTDGHDRITEVVDLPTTGVNTERIWLLEHFADWFNVNLGTGAMYHTKPSISEELVEHLDAPDADGASIMRAVEHDRKAAEEASDARQRAERYRAIRSTLEKAWFENAGYVRPERGDGPSAATGAAAAPAKPKRVHQPPKGEYAQHFDHVGKAAAGASGAAGDAAQAGTDGITVRQAHERLDLIERRVPLYAPWQSGLASALACAAFVFLLGGGVYDMVGAFVGAGLGQWLRRRLFAHHLNQFFVTFVVVAVAALACTGTLRLIGWFDPIALQHDTAYIGAMLFVIPGFPLITGGLDLAKIDFPSGIQRVAYVLCIVLMATLAGWMVASVVHLNPEGFEPLGLDPVLNGVLRFVAAFIGVWGFSVLFNSPQRMCLVAASIGAVTDTLRLELVDRGLAPEVGAFLGALLAGLLASAWRSSVRRGWLPPHLGYPRICLTVPSIVIMVPGMYMYQAMFHLGQFDTQQALDWAFRAFMIIICLPIGLAMARVITDKSWRYDI